MSIYDRVRRVVAARLDMEEAKVVPEARFKEDLKADSLDLVELVMALEDEFKGPDGKLEIPDEAMEDIQTVGQAVDYLRSRGVEDG